MGAPATKVGKVRVMGPLAPFVPAFRSRLKNLGYAPLTTATELRMVADWRPMAPGTGIVSSGCNQRADQPVCRRQAFRGSHFCVSAPRLQHDD